MAVIEHKFTTYFYNSKIFCFVPSCILCNFAGRLSRRMTDGCSYVDTSLFSEHDEYNITDHISLGHIQYFHDSGLVWPSETPVFWNCQGLAVVFGHSCVVGHSPCGVLFYDSGQQDRFSWQWGPVHAYAVKSDARGNHACCVHPFYYVFLFRREISLESFCSLPVSDRGGLFYIYACFQWRLTK